MKILFKVHVEGSKNAWTCKDFMISHRVANILPKNVLVVKDDTAILYGTPELVEVKNPETNEPRGFRLVGIGGVIVDQLALQNPAAVQNLTKEEMQAIIDA